LARLQSDHRFEFSVPRGCTWDDIPLTEALPNLDGQPGRSAIRSYFTSGSTGSVKRIDYSNADWRDVVAHRADCLAALGVVAEDIVAVLLPFGPWFSGDNVTDALLLLGATVVPGGVYAPHLPAVAQTLVNLGATAVVTTPSIALQFARLDPRARLRRLVLVGERVSPPIRRAIFDAYQVPPRSIFAASEAIIGYEDVSAPGAFVVDPNRIFVEVLRRDGTVAPVGTGELVVSRRYGEATPLVRYRLGDWVEVSRGVRPLLRFLGRIGRGVSLATGVKLSRAQLDQWLDDLALPIGDILIAVDHGLDGRDRVTIVLETDSTFTSCAQIAAGFSQLNPEVRDAFACGYVEMEVMLTPFKRLAKRRLRLLERPWHL